MARRIGAAAAAGLAVGLLLGLVARMFMRVVALASATPTGFSVAGTLAICLVFVVSVLPGAVVAAWTGGRVRWVLPMLGALLLGVVAADEVARDLSGLSLFTTTRQVVAVAGAAGIFAAIAALPVVTLRVVDRALSRSASRPSVAS